MQGPLLKIARTKVGTQGERARFGNDCHSTPSPQTDDLIRYERKMRIGGIDRTLALQQLAQAERLFSRGERHVGRQEARIATLDHHGHDTSDARKLLTTLRESQALHREEIRRLLRALKWLASVETSVRPILLAKIGVRKAIAQGKQPPKQAARKKRAKKHNIIR